MKIMKKSLSVLAILSIMFSQASFAQDAGKDLLKQLLSEYYGIKDALVAGNAATASSKAEAFVKNVNAVDYKIISEGNITTLVKDANAIAQSKDIQKQREIFANLSSNMAAVAKSVKLSDEPVYQQYCPMKKASWLSSEKAIKNPYYGSAMLTCGSLKETL